MITYNHERYIAQAIESVLMQKTTFPIELVVGEDCSKDGTRALISHYAALRPDIVRPILHERNVGMGANAAAVAAACRGEFIAVLEGDDYWTHPLKLQRQVDWLDAHPDSPLCFHDVDLLDDNSGNITGRNCIPKPPELVTIDELLVANRIPTCSVVYRRSAQPPEHSALAGLPMQDWPTWILMTRRGPAGYIDESWACYRMHNGGAWSTIDSIKQRQKIVGVYEVLRPILGPDREAAVDAAKKRLCEQLVYELVGLGRWREARGMAIKYLTTPPRRFIPPSGQAAMFARLLLKRPSAGMLPPPAQESR